MPRTEKKTERTSLDRTRQGVLLVNLGTPDSASVADVRRYLREFLSDPRVLDMSALGRRLLLYGVILPFRPRASARAYRQVFDADGSPLLTHGRELTRAVQESLGEAYSVELAMRYGSPSIDAALERLADRGVSKIVVLPLFPQYASSSTGSALEQVFKRAGLRWNVPALRVVSPFHTDPGFVSALVAVSERELRAFRPDHVILSYHGLPERQIRRSDEGTRHCLNRADCCDKLGIDNRYCYRAQCFSTSRALALRLGWDAQAYTVAFQSRLGSIPWIQPHTDQILENLYERGVRRLAVLCPSFVADCLETLEEIGIRLRQSWIETGGEEFLLVPCVNSHPVWVDAITRMIHAHSSELSSDSPYPR